MQPMISSVIKEVVPFIWSADRLPTSGMSVGMCGEESPTPECKGDRRKQRQRPDPREWEA
jgi:hypothetical protein